MFDHEGACDDSMTTPILRADVSHVPPDRESNLDADVEWCGGAGTTGDCVRAERATITLHHEDGITTGEIQFTAAGEARTIPFRALRCPVRETDQTMCG